MIIPNYTADKHGYEEGDVFACVCPSQAGM